MILKSFFESKEQTQLKEKTKKMSILQRSIFQS